MRSRLVLGRLGRTIPVLLVILLSGSLVAGEGGGLIVPEDANPAAARLGAYWFAGRLLFQTNCPLELKRNLERELLAKAQYDECYAGIGQSYPTPVGQDDEGVVCPESSQRKRNQAYVWGKTKVGDNILFGTVPNVHCLVMASYLGLSTPVETDAYVCEFGQAASGRGDTRKPDIFRYNVATGDLEDIAPSMATPAGMLLNATVGLRSAGSLGNVAFLAGPGVQGVHLFAYDGTTGQLLGAKAFPQYNDIREWTVVNGDLYTGVAFSQLSSGMGGAILRWVGEYSSDPDELFAFEEVGHIDGSAANLAKHEGRLFVTSWPVMGAPMGLHMSPIIPPGGLRLAHQDFWQKVWSITDYDPDPVAAAVTGGGAIESYKGHLYWGTMHVPGLATSYALQALDLDANDSGQLDPEETLATVLGTHRALSIFRGQYFGTPKQHLQVVYGETHLPRYDPSAKSYTIDRGSFHQNRMSNPIPLWGPSGFGNFFNNYTWAMSVFNGELYIGTMDFSGLVTTTLPSLIATESETALSLSPPADYFATLHLLRPYIPRVGADLYRVMRKDGRARPVFVDGVGNPMNYGVRTLLSDDALYMGSANPMNLHEDGGWELLRLTPLCDDDGEQPCASTEQ